MPVPRPVRQWPRHAHVADSAFYWVLLLFCFMCCVFSAELFWLDHFLFFATRGTLTHRNLITEPYGISLPYCGFFQIIPASFLITRNHVGNKISSVEAERRCSYRLVCSEKEKLLFPWDNYPALVVSRVRNWKTCFFSTVSTDGSFGYFWY